jgi:hypothetical protein
MLAILTGVKAGSTPVISANFARHRVVTQMLDGWNSLFQSKKYISSNLLTLYQRKDTPLILTHVNSGLWMCKVGYSHSLTACLVQCTTGHPPLGCSNPDSSPKSPQPVGMVSLWKPCHMSCTGAHLTNGNWNPKNSCVMRGCSNL